MTIRLYRPADLPVLLALFRDTVHTVCAGALGRSSVFFWRHCILWDG